MKTCPVCDTGYPDNHATCTTDGAVLIEVHELSAGDMVRGKYRILRKLGNGGMGVVYLAEHLLLGGQVALKFLASGLSRNPQFIKRFRNEARAAFQLRHPNIVEVMDLDQAEDGSLFIAMEFVEGPSLRTVISGLPEGLPIDLAVAIARGVASGLSAAHEKGTVHRDIKPENVLLTGSALPEVQPKVLDFGIAAILEGPTAVSRTRGLMLTPEYASPEQWRGTPAHELDGRADLYALGVMFYEMLTGRKPFHAHTMEGWMFQHLQEVPRPPSLVRPELAQWPGLDALVLRLLAKDREQRYRDADDLLMELSFGEPQPARKGGTFSGSSTNRPQTVVEANTVRPAPVPQPALERTAFQQQFVPMTPVMEIAPPAKKGFPKMAWAAAALLAVVGTFAVARLATSSKPAQDASTQQGQAGSGSGSTADSQPQTARTSTEDLEDQADAAEEAKLQKQRDALKAQEVAAAKAKVDAESAKEQLDAERAQAAQEQQAREQAEAQAEQKRQADARAAQAERQREDEAQAAQAKRAQVERNMDQVIYEVGVNPTTLNYDQKVRFVNNLQSYKCPCGCGHNVLSCFRNHPDCPNRLKNILYVLSVSK